MILPTIHNNGTSQDDLVEQLTAVNGYLMDALAAMLSAPPNGRDYYPQGPDAMARAGAAHRDRMDRIADVMAEIGDMALAISEGGAR